MESTISKPPNLKIIADDFGFHRSINEGIAYLLKDGYIDGASLMADGQAFDDVVGRLRGLENLSIGVHLVLVEEKPVLSGEQVPSLVGRQGSLHKNYTSFFGRYITGRIRKSDIEKELKAQIEKCISSGVKPDFLNSHQHLHLLPGITDIVIKLAKKYRIPRIRIVSEPLYGGDKFFRKIQSVFLRFLSRLAKNKIIKNRLTCNDFFVGFINAGNLSIEDIETAVELANRHPDKIIELGCHPGFENESLKIKYKSWGDYNWVKELKVLYEHFFKENQPSVE